MVAFFTAKWGTKIEVMVVNFATLVFPQAKPRGVYYLYRMVIDNFSAQDTNHIISVTGDIPRNAAAFMYL